MPPEPAVKRAVAFVDGQNLFFAARQAFGYTYPSYDFPALTSAVCTSNGWNVEQTRFYTGIPDASNNPFWFHFWTGKLRTLSRQGVEVFSRSLRYRNKIVKLPSGAAHAFLTTEEKGIDVRISLSSARRFARSQRNRIAGSRSHRHFQWARRRKTKAGLQTPTGSRSTR